MDATTPSPSGAPQDVVPSLFGVLETSLPPELGTKNAPDRCTAVAAVFSRRVHPQEQALIEAPAVRRWRDGQMRRAATVKVEVERVRFE